MTKILTESLSYLDMKGHITPLLGIDEFDSQIGHNSEIITLNFIVDGQAVGEDLVHWFERGYEWVIDSDISPGEVLDRKYYVFVELNRTSTAPQRILELLNDLDTLTDLKQENWQVKINNEKMPATIENIKNNIILKPSEYKNRIEGELNEWRELANLPVKNNKIEDEELLNWQRYAKII